MENKISKYLIGLREGLREFFNEPVWYKKTKRLKKNKNLKYEK